MKFGFIIKKTKLLFVSFFDTSNAVAHALFRTINLPFEAVAIGFKGLRCGSIAGICIPEVTVAAHVLVTAVESVELAARDEG